MALLALAEALDATQEASVHPTEVAVTVGWCMTTLGPAYGYAF